MRTRGLATLLLAGTLLTRAAYAGPDEDLDAARKLFKEALDDEDHGNFAVALDKFTHVQAVRDTSPTRYRMATCLEGLGRLREARDAYAHVAQAPSTTANDAEIAKASAEKAKDLDARIPHLIVHTSAQPPADLDVRVDGAPARIDETLSLDPGEHLVRATSAGARPYESKVTLGVGASVSVEIPIEHASTETPPPSSRANTLAFVALGVGGAFVAASVVTLVLREGDIHTLNGACPNGICPSARHDELQSAHDRASLEGPLAGGLGVVGLVCAAAGAYLLLRPHSEPTTQTTALAAMPLRQGALVTLERSF